jgi:hypothetical protein
VDSGEEPLDPTILRLRYGVLIGRLEQNRRVSHTILFAYHEWSLDVRRLGNACTMATQLGAIQSLCILLTRVTIVAEAVLQL